MKRYIIYRVLNKYLNSHHPLNKILSHLKPSMKLTLLIKIKVTNVLIVDSIIKKANVPHIKRNVTSVENSMILGLNVNQMYKCHNSNATDDDEEQCFSMMFENG